MQNFTNFPGVTPSDPASRAGARTRKRTGREKGGERERGGMGWEGEWRSSSLVSA